MYLRKIKAIQEGNLEGLEGIIAEIIAAIADSKDWKLIMTIFFPLEKYFP